MDDARIRAAGRIEERHLLRAAAAHGRKHGVAIAIAQRRRIHIDALGRAHPALLADHHGHRLAGHQFGFAQRGRGAADDQWRAARIAVLLRIGQQFVLDQFLQLRSAAEGGHQAVALLVEFVLFATDLHLFQPRELAQARVEDVVGLVVAQLEARHQHGLGFVLAADEADDLIEVEVCDQQAFEQVQAPLDLVETMLEPTRHRVAAETQPLGQERLEALDLRAAIEPDHVQVDAVALLEIRRREEVAHQLVGVDPVAARHQHDAGRVGVVGLVADVLQPRQLLGAHLHCDLLDHLARRRLVRQRGDDDVGPVAAVDRAGTDAADARLVHRQQVAARRDDLGDGRVIRPEHVLAQVARGRVRILEQADARAHHFVEVVRRHVRGHADRDARGAIEQQVRQARGQPRGLVHRAVEVGRPVDSSVAELTQQHLRDRSQPAFCVAHRRKRFRIVARSEIALAFDERIAVRKRLRHQHHRLVAGTVAMWMELADHVADGPRGFLRLGAGAKSQLAHGVDDPALHRLEAVAEEGQCAIQHDVHRVVEIRALGVLPQGDLFKAEEGRTYGIGHRIDLQRKRPAILAAPVSPAGTDSAAARGSHGAAR